MRKLKSRISWFSSLWSNAYPLPPKALQSFSLGFNSVILVSTHSPTNVVEANALALIPFSGIPIEFCK